MFTGSQKPVFIVGHKNPDCDSICSAIGYAYFKNILDKKYLYIPAKAGKLNNETKFVLEKFEIEPPMEIESLVATANDMELKKPIAASPNDSIRDVASLMKEKNIRTVPIIGSNKRLLGIVGLKDIAEHYMDNLGFSDISTTPIDLNILVNTLDAKGHNFE